jgi:hypothetical protein
MKKIIKSLLTVALLAGISTANAVPPETELIYGEYKGDTTANCDGFDVLNDNKWVSKQTTFFNKSGEVVRYREVGVFYEVVHYNSEHPEIRVTGGPVDKYDFRDNGGGLFVQMDHSYMLKLPGGGGVFMNAARIAYNANTGELTIVGRYNSADPDAIDKLCAAFAYAGP